MVVPARKALVREFSQLPVTALAFYKSNSGSRLILAGENTDLKCYDESSGQLVCQIPVFEEQPIQGIDIQHAGLESDGKALVWGSKYIAVLSLRGLDTGIQPVIIRGIAPDWVYDGRLSPFDSSSAVIATAHNEVVNLHVDFEAREIVTREVISPARPILYAAETTWTGESSVLMVAGTAFGEILVWNCFLQREPSRPSYDMLFVLTGHEGSIFGVNISPLMTLPDGSSIRLLATCSDDRTVRIWDITERAESKRTYGEDHFSTARETGFSGMLPAEEQPTLEGSAPVAIAMGHLSRIWGVKFAEPVDGVLKGTGMYVYSFGEDSTAQRWHFNIDSLETTEPLELSLRGRLVHDKTFAYHDGKHLWSRAISARDGGAMIVMGGADSRISLIDERGTIPDLRTQPSVESLCFDIPQLCADSIALKTKKPEGPGRFEFVSPDQMLAITTFGRVLLGTFTGDGLEWRQLPSDTSRETLTQAHVLKRMTSDITLCGTLNGDIYMYKIGEDQLKHVINVAKKVVDIIHLGNVSVQDSDGAVQVLVSYLGSEDPDYLILDSISGSVLVQERVTGLDPRFRITSATKVGDYFIIGSRTGFLSVHKRRDGNYTRLLDHALPSRDSVTSLTPVPSTSKVPSTGIRRIHILATCRDGKYRIYELEDDGDNPLFHFHHEASLPFGPLIEGAWFTNDASPQLVLYGFRSKYFVIWNETLREERLAVDCGGAHRTFSLYHGRSDAEPLRFAFNRASKLYISSQMKIPCKPLKKGTHGREVRALSCSGRYLASGSEDTTIRIWRYEHGSDPIAGDDLRCVASVKAHVTGIQTLKWLGDDYLFTCSGNEEFYVWRLRDLETDYEGVGIINEGILDDRSPDGDLRIMDFDVQRSETESDEIIITMVYSSSAFKAYTYSAAKGFKVFAKGAYTGACLTQIRYIGAADTESLRILTASTDGHISLWQTTRDVDDNLVFALSGVAPVHQNSIKCLAMLQLSDQSCMVLTGGDDNALGITTLTQDAATSDVTVSSRGIIRRAHAAAINDIIASHQDGLITAITVSNDQRLKTWSITKDSQGAITARLCENRYSGVADPGAVEFLDDEKSRIAVGGVGVEVWTLFPES